MGSFVGKGVPELLDKVGSGLLRGQVRVDQVYAKYQLLREDLTHRVGQAHYLTEALTAEYRAYLQAIADDTLDAGGPVYGMVRAVEGLANSSATRTPVLFFNLARSARTTVYDRGRIAYRREASQPRLSKAALRALRRRRGQR